MGKKQLSVPKIIINNEEQGIVPNSLVYDGGEVEITVSAVSLGGQKTESIHAENAENALGSVKFDMPTTDDIDEKIREWKSNIAGNVISLVERVGVQTKTITFKYMSLVNKIERGVGSDGKVSLEFVGDQASVI